MSKVRWALQRKGAGWEGEIELPVGNASVTATANGRSKKRALLRATALAEKVLSDPALQAVMPPQAVLALNGAKTVAAAAMAGKSVLQDATKKLAAKGFKKLASFAKSLW